MNARPKHTSRLSRRAFLGAGAGAIVAGAMARSSAAKQGADAGEVLLGVFSDAHFADRPPTGTRHYRDSVAKMEAFVRAMNEARPAAVIGLGDIVDKGESVEAEAAYLKTIEAAYGGFRGPRHHAIGNHDVGTFTKAQFTAGSGMPAPQYTFDIGPVRGIVVDANFSPDGTPFAAGKFKWNEAALPASQAAWLAEQIRTAPGKAIVFLHYRLDDDKNPHTLRGAADVRRLLEQSGKVLAVFSGHDHKGGFNRVGGIDYVTLRGMVEGPGVENNAFALVRVTAAGVRVQGFGKQPSYAGDK